MKACKRCKTNEAKIRLLICDKCLERNRKHNAKLITNKNLSIVKTFTDYGAYGGLGCEWDKGIAGHLENL